MRIVVHGQQAFGKAVLERLLERGEDVVAVCCAPTKEGKPEWKEAPGYKTPPERLDKLNEIFDAIEAWTKTKTKFEVMDICNPLDIPVGPILSMKEIAEDEGLRKTGTVVEVDHPERGPYLTVGCPIKMSDSPAEVTRSPLLGEHTAEILTGVLGYEGDDLARVVDSGAVGELKIAAE